MSESESQRPTAWLKIESEFACATGTDQFIRQLVPVLTNGHTVFCASDWYRLFVPIDDSYQNGIGVNLVSESDSQRPTAWLKIESEFACATGTDQFIRQPVPVLTNGHTDLCVSNCL